MAKMKITPDSVSVVKKTLTMSAPTGGVKPTADSTAFFQGVVDKRLANLDKFEKDFFKTYPNVTAQDLYKEEGYRNLLKGISEAALNKMRQANKGMEGYDKNGYPLPKISEKQKAAVVTKLTGK